MTRLLVCAGEASGDRLAADLLRELESRDPRLAVKGLAGPAMRERGVEAVARAEDVTAVGVVEAIAAAPRIWSVRRALEQVLDDWKPDLVVTIDSPGLLLGFARRARSKGFRVVHWVAPQVWAWRPGRVDAVANSVDALMCLFPFEPAWFEGRGVEVVCTGHPGVDRAVRKVGVREVYGEAPVFGFAPGSRPSEVKALWPTFVAVAERLRARAPGCRFVVARAPTVDPAWLEGLDADLVEDLCIAGSAADVFLACSGTVTLELAALGTPMAVVYRVHPLTWAVGRRLVTGVAHLALPNVLAGREIVPEILQDLDPDRLADVLWSLLGDAGEQQRHDLREVVAPLGGGAAKRAADVVERWARAP